MRHFGGLTGAFLVVLACVSSAQAEVVMDWATVGNPGNAADTEVMNDGTTGYGSVAYTYNIGKYEVTNGQYAQFLNAVAAVGDPNGLYNIDMNGGGFNGIGGISQTGSGTGGDPWVYSPLGAYGNRPVNFVSWYDTLRFANWMHNGQGSGAQDASTTEDGAYDMALGSSVVRKPGARVFLTTEDEWYKAAYYKGGGTNAGYWNYPTQSDAAPTAEPPPGTDLINGSANYFTGVFVDPIDFTTVVGAYDAKPSDSAYRTFDQGGNLFEWNETVIDSSRGVRGGSFEALVGNLHANDRDFIEAPTFENFDIGFRVAEVVVMDTVTVGNRANATDTEVMNDATTGYGGVAYTYNIGKYEVTNSQYAQFLNAVAATDTFGLYNASMLSHTFGCKIEQMGTSGSFTYSVVANRANRPVNFVSWYDTLRFANWMHNGQPTGAQDASTTEDGTYDMALGSNVVRKPGALVALTSEDEWYKAAYYKGGGTNAGYWNYPTQSDAAPTAEPPPGTDLINGSANYFTGVFVDPIFYTTVVGAYDAKPSDSAYRTFDQGGNLFEWNETVIDSSRGVRGGSFEALVGNLHANDRDFTEAPTYENFDLGFRVAEVVTPIPTVSEWGLIVLGVSILVAGALVVRSRRRMGT